jgi:hypothetical protein
MPFAILSLRPGVTSTVARPRLTLAKLPVMCAVRSASRIAGKVSSGRRVVPLVSISTDNPSSSIGGPLALKFTSGALPATTTRSTIPPEMWLTTHSRKWTAVNTGHMRLSTAIGMRVAATPNAKCGSAPE